MHARGTNRSEPLQLQRLEARLLGLDPDRLEAFARATGPVAVVDLETSGLATDPAAEIVEIGAVLIDPGADTVRTVTGLVRPRRPLPLVVERLTGLSDADFAGAPEIGEVNAQLSGLLAGRVLIAHNAEFERHFLGKYVDPELAKARYLDTQDLLSVTHPDSNDLRLESFTRALLGLEERHRALEDALDTTRIVSKVAEGAFAGERRYGVARRSLERFLPRSLWLAALAPGPEARRAFEFDAPLDSGLDAGRRSSAYGDASDPFEFIEIGTSAEVPVPFDENAIALALADEARGRRHLPGYRVRSEQIELARQFARNFANQGTLLLEGGTGVGKSFAYLAAAIPFALDPDRADPVRGEPVIVSTRTKLLQDQLLHKDIAAVARFLGYPGLRALSIKGRANYLCERRMRDVLSEGGDTSLLEEDRMPYAILLACARTRPHGEVGTLPGAFAFRHPMLRDMLRRSVAARAEQCTREECAHNPECPFGRRRRALPKAHLVVANHDLLLRWPPDYPKFKHVVIDEGHELAGVADEVYALTVRPRDVLERVDEVFPRTSPGASTEWLGHGRASGSGSRAGAKRLDVGAARWRHDVRGDLVSLGRSLESAAGEYGEVELGRGAAERFTDAAALAEIAAERLLEAADAGLAEERMRAASRARAAAGRGDIEALDAFSSSAASSGEPSAGASAGPTEIERAATDLRLAAGALRAAFPSDEEQAEEAVASFEGLEHPYDDWTLSIRAVSPADAFHEGFLARLESVALVSASMFIEGDAFAAIGELELEERTREAVTKVSVESPFPYATNMRALALDGGSDLVEETANVLAATARALGGRTLGLFTSLRRMNQVAQRLQQLLRGEGIEILTPRRAADDPRALVARFERAARAHRGGAVLLGARKFWQGLDIPGAALQAVVIEKLPFDVPTELRRRREQRLRDDGLDAFDRFTLGKMLLHLKQMTGRLIRTEDDRGLVVVVEGRVTRGYFGELQGALPPGVAIRAVEVGAFADVLAEVLAEIELAPASQVDAG